MLQSLVKAGDVLGGKYRVERIIAEGGMGLVVEATDLARGDRVAVKVLAMTSLRTAGTSSRFDREAKAAARIDSVHVSKVLGSGMTGFGAPFLVLELLRGGDLASLLDTEGPLPIDDAVTFMAQACEGVAAAHAHGIIHRDLKPANLFLTALADGTPCVKVLDFGVSKLASDGGPMSMTTSSTIVGTPLYMAPEQFASPRDVDGRADVWALGVCLYEMLVGDVPFREQNIHRQYALLITKPTPKASARRPDVPRSLDDIIARCLRRDPRERFATVAELAAALEAAMPAAARRSLTGVAKRTNQSRVTRLSTLRTFATPLPGPHGSSDAVVSPALGPMPELETSRGHGALLGAMVGALVMSLVVFSVARHAHRGDEGSPIVVYASPGAPGTTGTPEVTYAPRATPVASPPTVNVAALPPAPASPVEHPASPPAASPAALAPPIAASPPPRSQPRPTPPLPRHEPRLRRPAADTVLLDDRAAAAAAASLDNDLGRFRK